MGGQSCCASYALYATGFTNYFVLEQGGGIIRMTKQDIINQVCDNADLPRSKAEEAVETVIGLIKDALGGGEAVILRRFGTFQVRAKSKRIGRNPKTGEEAEISARKVVRFKSGKHFKQAVNDDEVGN
jgi:nucleoid DNA-binding protein